MAMDTPKQQEDDEYIVWNPVTHTYDPVTPPLPDPPTGILKVVKTPPWDRP